MCRFILPLAAVLMISACGGAAVVGPGGGGTGGGSTDNGPITSAADIPADLRVNVNAIAYDPAAQTLNVQIASLDSTPTTVQYRRTAALDVAGYQAYSVQEDALDRLFIALAAQSPDGSVSATTVADGGQFNKYFAGGVYTRKGAFERPEIGTGPGAGQVSYAGNYAGLLNGGISQGDPTSVLLPTEPGTDPSLLPSQSARVSGNIFLNANFADNSVNGSIYNRMVVDTNTALSNVILVATDITENGTFEGSAEDSDKNQIGAYGGAFGGRGANSVAGLVHLTEVIRDVDDEQEHGVFVLSRCGGPNDPGGVCSQTAPR
ncbi:thymidylate synthase [Sinirhodobacter hankyongi]|uniref:Thymidylate synthase n=2 Tax=Paenirhodobacter hankyongi TaxID=2294033 RepID=A0A421BQT8_9RHOB|nr:thymidylate synthase [Sinirhodobacter hankyongi]